MAISKHGGIIGLILSNRMWLRRGAELAATLATISSPASRVAILGSEPEIYFYAHRTLLRAMSTCMILPLAPCMRPQ